MNEIGKRIKSLRKEMGWTGEQLGKKMGITKTGVSYWETGKTSPDNKALIKLADLFGVSLDYLLGRSNDRFSKKVALVCDGETTKEALRIVLARNPRLAELCEILDGSSNEEVEKFIKVIKLMQE